jgi:hypothetical protein
VVYQLQKSLKMDIDLTTVIISIIASLFFAVPIAIDQWKNKKKDKD